MNVSVYGATGRCGSRIVNELVARGHHVTAVTRSGEAEALKAVVVKQDDLSDVENIAATIRGSDAVISAYAPGLNTPEQLVGVTERQAAAVAEAGVARLLVVGGAGVLEVAPGVTLIESGHLPEEWKKIAMAHRDALAILRSSDINWTYLSPAAYFDPGERTGRYRVGTVELMQDAMGDSRISMEDYAIAMVDELEKPAHERQSFSVGY